VVTLPKNGGCGAARNFGVLSANTEWLAFLDADDEWEPTFLEEVLDGIEKFNADFGSSGGVRKLEYKNPPTTSTRLLDGPPEAIDLTDQFWRQALKFMPIHPSALVIRRSLNNEVGGWCGEVRNGEDTPLYAEAWRKGRFVFVNKPLFTSIAPMTGVSAAFIPYHDIRVSLGRIGRSAIRSLLARKRGSVWLLAWWLTAVARRHALYLVRRFKLGKLIGRVRSRGAATARS
ncbi:MAG TPA: glycosyltransferase, partial [Candidatus Limnocylindrales bacterium]|nr:glycosyltransferase [Candidatus Limnocylindrales bacterium]